jgi:hypothetical protein
MNKEIQGYTHVQGTESVTWVVKHNLNCKPIVQVYVEVNGKLERMLPQKIVADNAMQVTVTFTTPRKGHVVLM